ncbi:MAG: flagellar motor protein MotB [Candidatus Eisenbacteria bacterium]|nr:flagellar motor protein MotB [Candidatus Eisenbacteria bacterium]
MARKKGPGQEEPASWLATFGDLATLLLTFYVLIYASSTYQPGDWETAQGAIERMLGLTPGESRVGLIERGSGGMLNAGTEAVPLLSMIITRLELDNPESVQGMEQLLGLAGSTEYGENLGISLLEKGILFRMEEPVLFRSGGAELDPKAAPVLRSIAQIIRERPWRVTVEGHTDDLPVRTGRYGSNWDLSGARAAEVVRFLVGEGVAGGAIAAKACGEYHPRFPNVNEEARRRNRRVDIRLEYED